MSSTAKDKKKQLAAALIVSLFVLTFSIPAFSYYYTDSETWQPSAQEQEMLERINRARKNPLAEANKMGLDEQGLTAVLEGSSDKISSGLPPLAWNPTLAEASYDQNELMVREQHFDHESADGVPYTEHAAKLGYEAPVLQNLAAGPKYSDADKMHSAFFIDEGVPGAGHRRNILQPRAKEIGISFVTAGGFYHYVWTADFGLEPTLPPMITGVVFNDANGNGIYDAGEGIPDVDISIEGPDGVLEAYSLRQGGYQVAISSPGEYRVKFSGGGLEGEVEKTVVVDDDNVKVDAVAAEFDGYSAPSFPVPDPTLTRRQVSMGAAGSAGCSLGLPLPTSPLPAGLKVFFIALVAATAAAGARKRG